MCYQEHAMRIAQRVAGFDDNQADSFLRKAQAKKKRALLELCNQWFVYGKINEAPPEGYDSENKNQPYYDPEGKYGAPILGGINNGYNEQDLLAYNKMIDGFSSYLFNKSHAACYSFLTLCCMYLKTYHRPEFFAALLSLQDKQETIALYVKTAKQYGINVKLPDINLSQYDFIIHDNSILYSLGCIKNAGEASIPYIIANRPYTSLQDVRDKTIKINEKGKKKAIFDKRIGEALIKAGAFEFINKNRNELLNEFQVIRKAKGESHFESAAYNKDITINYEKETLGISLTYTPLWDTIKPGDTIRTTFILNSKTEHIDKNGNLMLFIDAIIEDEFVKGVVFSSLYCKNISAFSKLKNPITAKITKNENGDFILKSIISY